MSEYHVAIAEDNPKTMELLNDMLENEDGIQVVGKARTGEEAYKMIVSSKPDVVLMDVIMPEMDGFEVLKIMKEKLWIEKIPVLVISGESSIKVEQECFEYGVSDFIHKPFDNDCRCF